MYSASVARSEAFEAREVFGPEVDRDETVICAPVAQLETAIAGEPARIFRDERVDDPEGETEDLDVPAFMRRGGL